MSVYEQSQSRWVSLLPDAGANMFEENWESMMRLRIPLMSPCSTNFANEESHSVATFTALRSAGIKGLPSFDRVGRGASAGWMSVDCTGMVIEKRNRW